MFDADEFYRSIERRIFVNPLRSTGEMENSFWQHVGKYYNKSLPTQGDLKMQMLANIDRIIAGREKHGFEQNKKTDAEKLAEKGVENAGY